VVTIPHTHTLNNSQFWTKYKEGNGTGLDAR